MEDMVKAMRRKAHRDIISELVQKKHAKNGERIESNAYTVAIQASSSISKTVTKGALYTAVTREYTNRYENSSPPVSVVAALSPSSASALTSPTSSSSSESTSNNNSAGLERHFSCCHTRRGSWFGCCRTHVGCCRTDVH